MLNQKVSKFPTQNLTIGGVKSSVISRLPLIQCIEDAGIEYILVAKSSDNKNIFIDGKRWEKSMADWGSLLKRMLDRDNETEFNSS